MRIFKENIYSQFHLLFNFPYVMRFGFLFMALFDILIWLGIAVVYVLLYLSCYHKGVCCTFLFNLQHMLLLTMGDGMMLVGFFR